MWAMNSILEMIFPERPDHKVVKETSVAEINDLYQPQLQSHWLALSSFQETKIRAAIHETKFHHNEKAITLLALLLKLYLDSQAKPAIIIPIPLSKKRQQKRGHNQVTTVAKLAVINCATFEVNESVLLKVIDTKPQTSLDKKARQENVTEAYALSNQAATQITGQHIILLDDVVTTGATFKSAKAALERLGPASIRCVALAH